ncbi:unnamed protein product [Citrullus colocynthis]|uniref:Uncharacterized protein n=1 Tax=Citrullus colocynthis TaxID=252529 RepID=A0ABP0Z6B9_9ROSI
MYWVVNDNWGGRSSNTFHPSNVNVIFMNYVLIWILEILLLVSHLSQNPPRRNSNSGPKTQAKENPQSLPFPSAAVPLLHLQLLLRNPAALSSPTSAMARRSDLSAAFNAIGTSGRSRNRCAACGRSVVPAILGAGAGVRSPDHCRNRKQKREMEMLSGFWMCW